ncbi:MAG: exo-beta-N-acetylmuramidase NamZ domain-containing protein [Rhodospirillaceae bacterium]
MSVVPGLTRLLASRRLEGLRVGLVCNPASVDAAIAHASDLVFKAPGVTLAALFGPQHGFRADLQDNMIESPHAIDALRRVPVHSLYSETREPTAEMLRGLDVLVIDLQDVGARIYTFVYTMANCLRAAARHRIPAVVCDRPNPIGGLAVEGPMLEPGFESFVGLFPIPMRHGMTIGELALLFNTHFGIGADLDVVGMDGWSRDMYFDDTGLPWVMPSPNMPTLDTAIVYPGAVLFEGTQVSEGRGTTRPFELLGAPWVDAERCCEELNALRLGGAVFRPVMFEPTFHKYAHEACGGCQIHVTDRQAFLPVLASVAVMAAFHRADPGRFAWRQPPYEYEHDKMPIDILAGSPALRGQIERGADAREIAASWAPGVAAFDPVRRSCLLY